MDDVVCNGNETSISNCSHAQVDDCGKSHGAGVECTMKEKGVVFVKRCKSSQDDFLI